MFVSAQCISNANMKMRRTKSCLATAPPLWSWTSSIHSKQRRWWWWGESLAEEWMADFCNLSTLVQVLCKTYCHVHICKSCYSAPSPPPLPLIVNLQVNASRVVSYSAVSGWGVTLRSSTHLPLEEKPKKRHTPPKKTLRSSTPPLGKPSFKK